MITIKNKSLSYDSTTITSSDYILSLSADIDATYIGILKFSNGKIRTLPFEKYSDTYKTRLIITSDILPYLESSIFYVLMINGPLSEETNKLQLLFDKEAINSTITAVESEELISLTKDVKTLSDKITNILSGNILKGIHITNTGYIKEGMIPVAIDDKGNFVATYPFAACIKEINGQKALNGVVEIDSSMIEYTQGRTVYDTMNDVVSAITALNESITALSDNQKSIASRLNELIIEFEEHKNSGIV